MLPPIAIRPAVEATFLNGRYVIRNQIGANLIALVHHHPQLIRFWLYRSSCRVSQAGGIGAMSTGIGVYFPNQRPVHFRGHTAFSDIAIIAYAHVEKSR